MTPDLLPQVDYYILETIALLLTALVLPGLSIDGPISAFFGVLALGFMNSTLWDAALFLQLPDSLTVHALTVVIANGVMFWFFVKLMPGISVRGVFPAIAAPLVFSVVSILLHRYARDIDWVKIAQSVIASVNAVRDQLKGGAAPSGYRF